MEPLIVFLIQIQCRRLPLLLLLPSSLQREHGKHTGNSFQSSSSQGVAVSELHFQQKLFHTAPSSFLKQLQRGGSLLPEVRRPNSDAGQRAGAEFPIRPSVGGEHLDCGAIGIILASALEVTLSPSTTFTLCGGFYPPRHSNCGFTLLQPPPHPRPPPAESSREPC